MTLKEFINKYNGKSVDFDGRYGPQCVDLFNQYLYEVLNIQNPIQQFPVASAYEIYGFAKKNPNFICIDNQPTNVPQSGDIVIWGTEVGVNGHVAIFQDGEVMSFTSFEENWNGVKSCQLVSHSYKGVLGWIRPKRNDFQSDIKPETSKPVFDLSVLDGNKTKIVTALTIIIAILGQQGYIDQHLMETLNLISTALIGYSLRDAIKKK